MNRTTLNFVSVSFKISVIFLLHLSTDTFGQEATADSLMLDTILIDDVQYNFVMVDFGYSSNSLIDRSAEQQKIPSLMADAVYFHWTGLWSGIFYSNYFSAASHTCDIDLFAGYDKTIGEIFDIGAYYSFHTFSGDTAFQGMDYTHNVNLSMSLNPKNISLFADMYYYNGASNNLFLDVGIGIPLYFDGIISEDDYVMCTPSVSLGFGTDHWLYEDMGPLRFAARTQYLNSLGYDTNDFGYQGLDLFIPITVGYKGFSLMFSWIYSIPGDEYKTMGWTDQTGIMVSLNYMLDYKRKER